MADNRFRFGIEHEVAFVRLPVGAGSTGGHAGAEFADFTNTGAGDLQAVVDALPVHLDDGLHVDVVRRKVGRWYVEGYDRYDEAGRFTGCDPKGIEIRTPVCDTIGDAVATLRDAAGRLTAAASRRGLVPVTVGFNPVRAGYTPSPPLNPWETRRRAGCPEARTAHLHMVTYGPDLNLSR
ncbi:MAG: glutamate--cysteine ligase, partial [Actinomycetota bacterium]